MKIGLLSDTHSYLDDQIIRLLTGCDEIWHAGDFGSIEVSDRLNEIAPLRGVYGNIDDAIIRQVHPKVNRFIVEGLDVMMTHIGGYPGKYHPDVRNEIKANPPQLYITGHSHILKVMPDKSLNNLLHLNPGAAGKHGFHTMRTMMRFDVNNGKVENLQVIELGKRA
ncbi:metallophosphoesterase family protein [Pontibacter sp. BT310]|uniref:Phosphoesterase n=1 Tax=Pontibacter populi TaxID=890055 RepID=A0ABS6XAB6_9BACT|nr:MULTISPECIES: metallophosphoesterase family protein [Pontibacter]MBJ6118068.1 metallophosphoesterase family protein [Pontibacter sp. BT310]MBW3364921.1 metallophosphatase family protein [Pontibacter populi]